MRHFLATLAVPLAAMASLAAAADGERLASPPLAGYVLGYSAGNAAQTIREEVPRGENVQRWTRMVTTQRFTGLAARSTPQAYVQVITGQVPRSCPGAAVSPIVSLSVSGRPASRLQVDCPRSEGGVPETFILLAIAGRTDMHVKQVAFRGRKTAADLSWASDFLARTVLCAAGSREAACR